MPEICDYEGSDYRHRFWTHDRRYEDLAERQVLARLLPPSGEAIAELGAGFGRLADLYQGFQRVYLVDYSRTLLRQAQEDHADDPRFTYVAADIRRLPLADASFDAVVTVRVLHHLRDIAPALAEAQRVLRAGAPYLLEFANKRNLKAIGRYALRRQEWSPFERAPVEFAELNLDFHPQYMRERLAEAGLDFREWHALSLFRVAALKQRVAPRVLTGVERALRPLASLYPVSPSVIVVSRARKPEGPAPKHFLACPACHGPLQEDAERAACAACRLQWPSVDGILDFKSGGKPL